ncbi:MAG: hypothetical protein GXP06_07910 [Alphaproteobacteria bacterium]|nr:hypothetical protein [Alphaproteobacteria bacterium]
MHDKIESRLEGMQKLLLAQFEAGSQMSSATKGEERELFVKSFLSQVFPPHFRFASGDITDFKGTNSGQVDIVLESPFLFSLPAHPEGPRLFFAEGVAAVIEVKSDLTTQWGQVLSKVKKIKSLKRQYQREYDLREAEYYASSENDEQLKHLSADYRAQMVTFAKSRASKFKPSQTTIPTFVVGFKGWKDHAKFQEKWSELQADEIKCDGLLCLDSLRGNVGCGEYGAAGQGTVVLWGFIQVLANLVAKTTHQPLTTMNYGRYT